MLVWWWLCRKTKSEFDGQPGWRRILISFHVAAAFSVAETLAVCNVSYTIFKSGLGTLGIYLALPFIGIPLVIWSLAIYQRARAELRSMQQDAAVRIAKRVVYYAMRQQRTATDSLSPLPRLCSRSSRFSTERISRGFLGGQSCPRK
ncbi:MAG: hypothetical protein IH897_04105 [Planctomycetes bacterium]|nr:hypothetical protein [Planctomycetota bacterium]